MRAFDLLAHIQRIFRIDDLAALALQNGQVDRNRRAHTLAAGDRHRAAMQFRQGTHQRQPQTCAALVDIARITGLLIGFAERFSLFWLKADTAIANRENEVRAQSPRHNDDSAARRGEFHGIG